MRGEIVSGRVYEEQPGANACAACRYFYPCKTIQEWEDGAEPEQGECRRMPPVLVEDGAIGYWPMVDVSDWCGEWRP